MSQHIHILGICGTFMGGLALLARDLGYRVSGADENVYPPMSTQLAESGIHVVSGYDPEQLNPPPDLVVIGNAMSRGNPVVEAVLNKGIPYTSGPQWLGEQLLSKRWVLAVSGTHGKTTTSSMLAWILDYAGMSPGFLIGGVPHNFNVSARLGETDFFVIEADEYDTAFFDKRSKFIHYRPRTLVIGNIEFDHADIFPDLAAIETQFHHLVRCVPSDGIVICPKTESVERVLARGVWTPVQHLSPAVADHEGAGWRYRLITACGDQFELTGPNGQASSCAWSLLGEHNVANACAAVAAAHHVGVPVAVACQALTQFSGVKRRLELRGEPGGVRVYDDFAHHPTAIQITLEGLRAASPTGRLIAVIEPRSNTMRSGIHGQRLASATAAADKVFWYQPPGLDWSLERIVVESNPSAAVVSDLDALVQAVASEAAPGDAVVIMSNGGFGGFHERLLAALTTHSA